VVGLRGNECVHARLDTLERWLREATTGIYLEVLEGTKTGRPRSVRIVDKEATLRAIRDAIVIAERQGGFLVVRQKGGPSGGLDRARDIYHSFMKRQKIVPHRPRYAWAQRTLRVLESLGFSRREALLIVVEGLGHGRSRTRWATNVYLQKETPPTEQQLAALLGPLVWPQLQVSGNRAKNVVVEQPL